jgi:pimeloyl-ACP methyl ester carboxylesterase
MPKEGDQMGQQATVVLAHGAWADGSSWHKVIAGLATQGIKAIAAPLPLTSLADDVAALDRTIERVDGPVVLAGHAFADAFAPNASAEELAVLAAVQRPIALACITAPVSRPLWKDVPTWYLLAQQDRMIVEQTQRFMAERMQARISAHEVDHTPIVTAPGVVVDLILQAPN